MPCSILFAVGSLANLVISDTVRNDVDSFAVTQKLSKCAESARGKDMKEELNRATAAESYRALRNLAYNNAASTGTIATAGGIAAAKAVLKLPGAGVPDSEVQTQALGLVLNLALDHAVNAQRLDEAGIVADMVEMIREILRRAGEGAKIDVALLGQTLDTSLILSTQPAGQKALTKAQATPLLVEAMQAAAVKADPVLARSVVAILGNLATEASQAKAIHKVQGAPAVVEVMKLHNGDAPLQEAAAGALRNMCVDEHGRMHTANADGIAAIIDAMRTHAEVPRVLQNAISALINLCQSSTKNKAAMRRAGVIPLVKSVLQAHPNAQHLMEVGMFFLQELGVKSL